MNASHDQMDRVDRARLVNPVEHATTVPAGIWAV